MYDLEKYGQKPVMINVGEEKIIAREIVLPLPPSENARLQVNYQGAKQMLIKYRKYQKKTGVFMNTEQYKRWMNISCIALRQNRLPVITDPVGVLMTVIFPDNRRRDAQNREKAFFDALTQSRCVYADDEQVAMHCTIKKIIKKHSLLVAYVFKLSDLKTNIFSINDDYLKQIIDNIDKNYNNIAK